MAAIFAASAVALNTQPGQAVYLGPIVNITLNDLTCPPKPPGAVLQLDEALIEEQPSGEYLVIPDSCDASDFIDGRDTSGWRWQTQKPGRFACNCRNDYPAWLTLRGSSVPDQGICDSYEAAYGWLYGEPSETIKWMTIPPQYNISIPNNYTGQEFQNPDPKDTKNTNLICNSTNIIQKANRCFHNVSYEAVLIPVNQGILNETEALCRDDSISNFDFQIDCCVNATIEGREQTWFVRRDIFFAAACDSTTRALNNGDGRYHTGAEQTWTRGMFTAENVTTENITQAILGLVTPKPYVPNHARSSVDAAGFNEVCIPDGVDLPAVLQYSGYTQTASTPSANTGTELHTTSMVPRNLRTFGSGTVKNPLHGSPEAVKRWALHFLIGFNESLADHPAPGTYFNPVHYAREFIRVNPSGRVYESGINKLNTSNQEELHILPWIRNYASSRRGATPGIGGRVSKNAYHVPGGPPAYTLEDYFRICPKASRRPAPGPPRHLTAAQDYSEGAGHPLVSYQFFVQPGAGDKYWLRNGQAELGTAGFTEKSYPTDATTGERSRFASATSTQYDCAIEEIPGFPSGSPFWTEPPDAIKGWGSFGNDLNFLLNCTATDKTAIPGGSVNWPSIIKELGGYNNVPTAGKVTPQVLINQDNTQTANNLFESTAEGTAEFGTGLPTADSDNLVSDSVGRKPPPLMQGRYRSCSDAGALAGRRSRGFLVPVETLFAINGSDIENGMGAASGEGTRSTTTGKVVAAIAAKYGFSGTVLPEQMYGVAYAVLGIDDFVAHNHAGAGTLFPEQAVLGSRPRIDDLVGNMDLEDKDVRSSMVGSCGDINDRTKPDEKVGFIPEGGKSTHLPLNTAGGICAVFSGTGCGVDEFNAKGGFGPQTWSSLNSFYYHQFVNQYNLPGFQMSLGGGDDYISTKIPFPPNVVEVPEDYNNALNSENHCWAHLRDGGCGNNGKSYSRAQCHRLTQSAGGKFHCFSGAEDGVYVADNPTCDPRKYGINLQGNQNGCTNARARFKTSSDYSVWPFIKTTDTEYSISGTGYANLVPTGLFSKDSSTGSDQTPTLQEFLAQAQVSSGNNPYAIVKQLYPRLTFPGDDGGYDTNLSSMSAFESCQCFAGPLNSDGLPNYEPYSGEGSGLEGNKVWGGEGDFVPNGCTASGGGTDNVNVPDHEKCSPPRQGDHTYNWRCSGRKGGGRSCYTTRRPQMPGPFPRNADFSNADIESEVKSGVRKIVDDIVSRLNASNAPKRWWTQAFDGLPAVRVGVIALTDESIWGSPGTWLSDKKAFRKRLYRVTDPATLTEFGYADLGTFVDVSILDVGDSTNANFIIPNRTDEANLYVRTESRDMCNDFGRNDNITDWAAHTLSDELFEAVLAGTPVEYGGDVDPAAMWNATGTVPVCAGNLHGMPSNMPGVCGPIPELEAASAASRELNFVPCSRTGIDLPVCGNPYFNTDSQIVRPQIEGQQYAHYCSPTTGITGYLNTSASASPTLLQCFDDVLVRNPLAHLPAAC